jgi:RNA-directed DNA polymerase
MSELLNLLIVHSGMDLNDLLRVIRTAPRRYKVFEIDKRNGEKREIAQPARELKQLQRIMISEILEKLPVHPAAKAYRAKTSILDNARPHGGNSSILKMDFENFFPSIRSDDWLAYCDDLGLLSPDDRLISANILFRQAPLEKLLKLSVGAPSSPILSNILMLRFDEIVVAEAQRRGISYTRYADDLTFSGQRIGMLKDMVKEVERATRKIVRPKLTVNHKKTTFVTTAQRRSVTGVVLANNGDIGIGRDRRRLVSSRVHRAILGQIIGADLRSLAGELAFVNVVEPRFIEWLCAKYGNDAVKRIKRLVVLA